MDRESFNEIQEQVKDIEKEAFGMLPSLLTIQEVADIFRVSKLTIKRWGKKGILDAIRINSRGDRRYRKEVVIQYLESRYELHSDK